MTQKSDSQEASFLFSLFSFYGSVLFRMLQLKGAETKRASVIKWRNEALLGSFQFSNCFIALWLDREKLPSWLISGKYVRDVKALKFGNLGDEI